MSTISHHASSRPAGQAPQRQNQAHKLPPNRINSTPSTPDTAAYTAALLLAARTCCVQTLYIRRPPAYEVLQNSVVQSRLRLAKAKFRQRRPNRRG